MFITVTNSFGDYPENAKSQLFLIWDGWNDYSFLTLYGIFYIDENLKKYDIGQVKIGHFGQKELERKINVGDTFETLDERFFSVGLDFEYYEKLNKLGEDLRNKILISIRDIAKNDKIYQKAILEEVTKVSFLRGLSELTITGQFRRLANGGVALTPYNFQYISPESKSASINLNFDVIPYSNPPTNLHVIIGRNGVGKTYLINNMIDCLTKSENKTDKYGNFKYLNNGDNESIFANLICITFSAFDEFEHPIEQRDKSVGIQYSYIGLKNIQEKNNIDESINLSLLNNVFVKSITNCINSSKINRWLEALKILESDPIFKAANILSIIENYNEKTLENNSINLFRKLSSGHKIVLLSITRLVETIQEKSLVLIDEPESHLHPPLLSSFIRAISALLTHLNGVCIIATHSPVILQEVPKSCVWKLRRTGHEALAERLQIESFGENVGILTNEVFRLEVTNSGFHKLLQELVNEYEYYEQVIDVLNNQIGLEAKAILRSMFYNKNKSNEEN